MNYGGKLRTKQLADAQQDALRFGRAFQDCSPADQEAIAETMLTGLSTVIAAQTASRRPVLAQQQSLDDVMRAAHRQGITLPVGWQQRQSALVSADQALLAKQRTSIKKSQALRADEEEFRKEWNAKRARRDQTEDVTEPE